MAPEVRVNVDVRTSFSTKVAGGAQELTVNLATVFYTGFLRVTINSDPPTDYEAVGEFGVIGSFNVNDGDELLFEALDGSLDPFCQAGSSWAALTFWDPPSFTQENPCVGGFGSFSCTALASEMAADDFTVTARFNPAA